MHDGFHYTDTPGQPFALFSAAKLASQFEEAWVVEQAVLVNHGPHSFRLEVARRIGSQPGFQCCIHEEERLSGIWRRTPFFNYGSSVEDALNKGLLQLAQLLRANQEAVA